MNVLNNLKLTPYGFSHGEAIGFKLDNISAGHQIDFTKIDQLLVKRSGSTAYNTTRVSNDKLTIKSGFVGDVTDGTQIWIELKQDNFRKKDYPKGVVRPGHADLSAYQKYGDSWNHSGGGQFSGRLTVLYVIAGEIARQVLNSLATCEIFGHVSAVGPISDHISDYQQIKAVQDDVMPIVDNDAKQQALSMLSELKRAGDSVGGKLDIYIDRLGRNYGDDFFASLESKIAFLMFSVPAVKAVEFGIGTEFARKRGSEVVETLIVTGGHVQSPTNYNGGINGGIANLSAPIRIRVTIKPTSSLLRPVPSVKFADGQFVPAVTEVTGRHDSFIANRALWPLIGLLYILFLDLELEEKCLNNIEMK
ncbi:chorismate synthase [Mollicutes bacterium LVI A0039]|nr:chorismate synthase [Mollicutes bacterium LVI A0039]